MTVCTKRSTTWRIVVGIALPFLLPGVLHAAEEDDLRSAFAKGLALQQKEDLPAAAAQFERALALAPRVFGPNDANTAAILNNLAGLYQSMDQPTKAEPLFKRSLKIFESKGGADSVAVAQNCFNLGNLYQSMGRFAEAEQHYLRSLRIFEAQQGSDHLDVASVLNNLASMYETSEEHAKAEPLHIRCLRIRETKLGSEHPDVAQSLNNLANIYESTGQYAKAEPLHLRSLRIYEAKRGPEHLDVADSLYNLANLYESMSEFSKAQQCYERSLKIREVKLGPQHIDVASTLNNLALLYDSIGEYATAEPLFRRNLRILESKFGTEHPEVADTLNNMALLYESMGKYSQAEPLYQRSLKIRETKLGNDHLLVAHSLNNLGGLYKDMGLFAKAELLELRSLSIKEAKLGPDHVDVADSLNNLANLYTDMKQFDKAESLHLRSLKIREAHFGVDHLEVAASLNNLALFYVSTKQFDKAEPLYLRSLAIKEAKLDGGHPDIAISLNNLANLYDYTGRLKEAEACSLRCVSIREAKLGPNHPDVSTSLFNLGMLYQSMGQHLQAANAFDRARRIIRRHITDVLPVLSDNEQLSFLQVNNEARLNSTLTLAWQSPENAVLAERSAGWLVNGKAVAQQSLAERALLARDTTDPAVAVKAKQLLALRNQLAGLSVAAPKKGEEDARQKQLAKLIAEEQGVARQVNLAAGRPTLNESWVEVSVVRSALPKNAMLVDIVRFKPRNFDIKYGDKCWQPARYAAWLIPPADHGNVQIVDLGEADKIDSAVAAARDEIGRSADRIKKPEDETPAEAVALSSLGTLAELVLTPLQPHLRDSQILILSPDSALWLAPWAALPVDDGQYAIERWRIRYVISGRDVVTEHRASDSKRHKSSVPIIFADPDFDLESNGMLAATRAVLRSKEGQLALRGATIRSESGLSKVSRLPGTADEANLIKPYLETYAQAAPIVYSQRFALEGVLKAVASPRVLTLSTHGYYLTDQSLQSPTEVNSVSGHSEPAGTARHALLSADGTPYENALLRCGLLLAGCNRSNDNAGVDDGVVTGMEIVGCDLRGTDLVVLSACDTGLGQVRNGEGVAGLRQAFQLAGAKAVVSTLWRIPDAETAMLMGDFFRNLAAGKSKDDALREAQIALINVRRSQVGAAHPIYWAAFTITGN